MITSSSNAQIKRVQQLLKKAKTRREEGVFVVEGIKMFKEDANRENPEGVSFPELCPKGSVYRNFAGKGACRRTGAKGGTCGG